MNNDFSAAKLEVKRPGLVPCILYGFIIALLLVLLGETIQLRNRLDRVYDQVDELDRVITRGAMTGRVGEVVR